ncbi:tyrosyl-tRNA synthetase [Strigomonas culicis]|uniref:tyrosine--tRNA ligase n=1 Tax=Strigomonas culicis TaxID=28005 RepID=S9U8I6_9TRYP|nr:tyrosyl-tRNA synthetase [Strigomonas culicis]|eukprot:EPY25213.1 tyrosyl-tRNA synthetase [Strigomonas culicis]
MQSPLHPFLCLSRSLCALLVMIGAPSRCGTSHRYSRILLSFTTFPFSPLPRSVPRRCCFPGLRPLRRSTLCTFSRSMADQTPSPLSNDERYALLRSVGEECIQEGELRNLVEKKPGIRCYDGFEPSGRMHIAQGIFKSVNVNKCTTSGCLFVFWVADWFALMNDKVGGELEKIRIVGKYLIEVWTAAGMDMDKVEFLWASDEITQHAAPYWKTVLDIGRRNTIARIKKCCAIMGKSGGHAHRGADPVPAHAVLRHLLPPGRHLPAGPGPAQGEHARARVLRPDRPQAEAGDTLASYAGRAQAGPGQDEQERPRQRHLHGGRRRGRGAQDHAGVLARASRSRRAPSTRTARRSPTDDKNPVLDYYQCVVFARPGATTAIGGRTFAAYADMEAAYVSGELSEEELKRGLVHEVNALLEPVRQHFATNAEAKQLLELVKSFRKGGEAPPLAEEKPREAPARPLACLFFPATFKLPLDTAAAVVAGAKRFLAEHPDGEVVLLLPQWMAVACDELTGDEKDVKAALAYNVALLREYGLPAAVRVEEEEALVLADPNTFWYTAINVGRKNTLAHVEEVHGGEVKNAGQVVAAMMRVADVVLLNATHVLSTSFDGNVNQLVSEYTNSAVAIEALPEGALPPLHRPDVAPTPLGADDVLHLDDTDMDIRRKIKKAYSAPNERSNPVIAVAVALIQLCGSLQVERGEANGGNVDYTEESALREDCGSGALHPGDLKAAVVKVLLERSASTRAAMATPDNKKLSQTLRNAEKKLSKKK